jgi:L-iditol 2-dehydrogenase
MHVHDGHANWNVDAGGAAIPFSSQPQILGHEMVGEVVELGSGVTDLKIGDRVVLDQGINCASRGRPRASFCEYCSTGFSHHCVNYEEHGITGLPGGFADCIAIPAVNAVRIEGDLPSDLATMVEPLGCVLHNLRLMTTGNERFSIDADDPRARIKNIAICGLGPSGQIFGKALRNILGFEGTIIVTDPRSSKLQLAAASFDGTPIEIDGSTTTGFVSRVSRPPPKRPNRRAGTHYPPIYRSRTTRGSAGRRSYQAGLPQRRACSIVRLTIVT